MSCGIVPIIIDRMLNWGVKFSRVAIFTDRMLNWGGRKVQGVDKVASQAAHVKPS